MQKMNWIGFALSNTLTKSVVHFLPTSNSTNAPYPISYNIKIVGKEIGEKSITIDDGRLGQPDGVRLEDIFPILNDAPAGLLALSVELSTTQSKVDLSASTCVIEIITASNSVRYFAEQVSVGSRTNCGMLAVNDAYNLSSVMLVNFSGQPINPSLLVLDAKSPNLHFNQAAIPAIESNTAFEYIFEERFYDGIPPQECSWGLFRSNSVSFAEDLPPGVAAFCIYRDTLTKRIMSVKGL